MMNKKICRGGSNLWHRLAAAAWVASVSGAAGSEWPQWRGPARDGLVPEAGSVRLVEKWPEGGPKLVWESEPVPGGDGNDGGYGSLAVAGGRVYVYVNWQGDVALPARLLMPDDVKRLGTPEFVGALAVLTNRIFALEEDVDRALRGTGLSEDSRAKVLGGFSGEYESRDVILCFDAANGETLWQVEYPGVRYNKAGSSSTPTIADGKCYVIGANSFVYCLDAQTGREIWKTNPSGNVEAEISSSVVVVDGMAIGMCVPLTALDADTGRIVWRQPALRGRNNSPVVWTVDGKPYLLCNDKPSKQVACVDASNGRVVWTVDGGGVSTVVISGDVMVVFSAEKDAHLSAYRLSETVPESMWRHEQFVGRGESPVVVGGYVYIFGMEGRAACVKLDTGDIAWGADIARSGVVSPIALDGKIVMTYAWGKTLLLIQATPDRYTVLAEAAMPLCMVASPSFADGRLFLRMKNAVACYDLGPVETTDAERKEF